MTALAFRTATEADIPALIALVTSAYRGDDSRRGWTTEADILDGQRIDADMLREDLARPRSAILIAEYITKARDAGMIACAHVAVENDGAAYFGMFRSTRRPRAPASARSCSPKPSVLRARISAVRRCA
jgi:hypothetical protein